MRAANLLVLGALVASVVWAVWMNRVLNDLLGPLLNIM